MDEYLTGPERLAVAFRQNLALCDKMTRRTFLVHSAAATSASPQAHTGAPAVPEDSQLAAATEALCADEPDFRRPVPGCLPSAV